MLLFVLEGLGEHLDAIGGFEDAGLDGVEGRGGEVVLMPGGRRVLEEVGGGAGFGVFEDVLADEAFYRPGEVCEHGFSEVVEEGHAHELGDVDGFSVVVFRDPEGGEGDHAGVGGDGLWVLDAADDPACARELLKALGFGEELKEVIGVCLEWRLWRGQGISHGVNLCGC